MADRVTLKTFNELTDWRVAILKSGNTDALRALFPSMTAEVAEITLHKCRYDCTDLPAEMRHASRAWLDLRHYGAMGGRDLLPEGELP